VELHEIEDVLVHAFPGAEQPVLEKSEAIARARMVWEDMAAIGLPLQLKYWLMPIRGDKAAGIPSYFLPGSQFNLNAPEDTDDIYKAEGPGLNCGDFLKLSKACKLGRTYLRKAWPKTFSSRLRDPNDHPAVVEEMLWLGYWLSLEGVTPSYRQNPTTKKNVDWRFRSCGQTINLENKYRRRDWVGRVDGPYFSRDFDSYFQDCEGKFGPQKDGELNIIGISTLAPPDAGLRRAIGRFLERNPEVDAIIFWSYHSPRGETPEIHSQKADLIKLLFTGGDEEDHVRMSPIQHLWRKSDERRALRPGEFPKGVFGI
jgi:hypothetical protein